MLANLELHAHRRVLRGGVAAQLVEFVRGVSAQVDGQQFAALCASLGEDERKAVEYALR